MARQEIQGGNTIDIKKEDPIVEHEGVYQGFKGITTDIGPQVIYQFEDPKSKLKFGIYGFTTLNMKMESISSGAYCYIQYLGTKNMKTKFGMKDVHICKVEIDPDYKAEPGSDVEPF